MNKKEKKLLDTMREKLSRRIIKARFYLCGVTWQYELPYAGDVVLYQDVKALKKTHKCTKQCGIVEVEATVRLKKWVVPQDLSFYRSVTVTTGQ